MDRYHPLAERGGFRQKAEAVTDSAVGGRAKREQAQLLDVLEAIRIAHACLSSKSETETKAEAGVGGVSGNDGVGVGDVRESQPAAGRAAEGTRWR